MGQQVAPLIATDIHKCFGELEVLKGISLEAHKGDVISVIGSSGSGKSTFLRCINMLEIPTSGDIQVHGEKVAFKTNRRGEREPADIRQVEKMRAQLSMVFQGFNLWAHMSILQNVMEAPVTVLGRPRDEVEAKAREYLDKVGIGDKADVYPAQLSGGQQQRAAIARALCMEPEALLFDEPTSSLDPETTGEVLSVMAELAQTGMTMIVVTHEMSFARKVSDRVVMMENGVVQYEAEPNEFFEAQDNERLRAFLSSME